MPISNSNAQSFSPMRFVMSVKHIIWLSNNKVLIRLQTNEKNENTSIVLLKARGSKQIHH